MAKHLQIKISGNVQGVGFRFCAYEKFVELGLVGKAENTPDGGVMVNAQGEEAKLQALVEWCGRGPMGARVANVETRELSEPFVPVKNG